MKLLAFCKAHGVQLVAHCPLGGALASEVTGRQSNGPLQDPVVSIFTANSTNNSDSILTPATVI